VKSLITGVQRFLKNEEGVTAIEYGLIAALIAVVIIVAVTAVGTNLEAVFQNVADELELPAAGG
jgi:pilus assembly protein Flp/PilA